jgi:two-component system, chemotaxis family, response regulator Rcp1
MNPKLKITPIEILLVEDNPGDVRLILEGFQKIRIANEIHTVGNGVEAIDYLCKKDKFASQKSPDLVILDLNLPLKSGREVLKEMKTDPIMKSIPVIILSSSASEEDIVTSYRLNANCYITKPIDLDEFFDVIKSISDFWISLVKLP